VRLNFWQILGVLLLIAAGIVFFYERNKTPAVSPTPTAPAGGAVMPGPVE
jgi:hypothetical protein